MNDDSFSPSRNNASMFFCLNSAFYVFKHFFVLMHHRAFGVRRLPQGCAMTVTFFNTTTSESLEELERQKNLQSKNSTNDHGPSFFEQPERYRKSEWPKNLNTMAGLPFAKGE